MALRVLVVVEERLLAPEVALALATVLRRRGIMLAGRFVMDCSMRGRLEVVLDRSVGVAVVACVDPGPHSVA